MHRSVPPAPAAKLLAVPSLLLLYLSAAPASAVPTHGPETPTDTTSRGSGLLLGAGHAGLGIGNLPTVHGVRLNFRDEGLRQVNGLNVTLWKSGENGRGTVNGVAVGLVAPVAGRFHGLAAGGLGVTADGDVTGIAAGGVGVAADGELRGPAWAATWRRRAPSRGWPPLSGGPTPSGSPGSGSPSTTG